MMDFFTYLSNFMIPLMIFYIVAQGFAAKRPVYDDFIKGAKDGIKITVGILPTLVGLMAAVEILRASGFLEALAGVLAGITARIGIPGVVLPVIIVKLFSSSAATGLALDIFKELGTDSLEGLMSSIMLSCTETVFYTMSIYFMSIGVKKTRATLPGALFATFAGVAASVVLARMMSG